VPHTSSPEPDTVKTPLLYEAEPAVPTSPMSTLFQPEGSAPPDDPDVVKLTTVPDLVTLAIVLDTIFQ